MADLVDEIKARIGVYELISQYVQLKKAGQNYKACCPFHSEKTASFVVSPEKQIFHCFGCNKGGDIFSFVQEMEGVTFPEAVQILADKAGLKVEKMERYNKKGDKDEKEEYFRAHELACEFFEEHLWKGKEGKMVLDYLYSRGVTDDTIKEFRIGFAPDEYEALYPCLLKKGIKKEVLLASGFVTSKRIGENEIYDKFRARLMFPIFDYFGRICGFGGRALKKDQSPKYLNSPENIIYSKSKVLYGLSHAKQAIKEAGEVILVEGYFDVVMPYQAGIKNVVATSGTALTSEQVRMLKRITKRVVTCFDMDSAGFEAGKRAYFLCQPEGLMVRTASGMELKDPADFVKEHGDKFTDYIGKAKDFVLFYLDELLKRHDVSTMEGRRQVIGEVLPIYKEMSATERDFYVRDFAKMIKVGERALYDEINNFSLPLGHPAKEIGRIGESKAKFSVVDLFFGLLLQYPQSFSVVVDNFEESYLDEEAKSIYRNLLAQYNSARTELERWDVDKAVSAEQREKIDVLTLYVEDQYQSFSEEAVRSELIKFIDKIKKDYRLTKLKDLQNKIAEAEKSADKGLLMELLSQQQNLLSD